MTFALRDYQVRAIDQAREHVRAGRTAPLLVSPTGSGKTAIGIEFARLHIERGGRVLWLAHRVELIEQAYDTARARGVSVGAIGAAVTRPRDPEASLQVAMLPTLVARGQLPAATMAIVDEAHHAVAPEYFGVVTHYPFRVGLTATPERQDGRGLGHAFDALVVVSTIRKLTDAGHLVPCDVVAPPRRLRNGTIAQSPLVAYRLHCEGRRTIVFAQHVAAAEEYYGEFRMAGVRVGLVTGEMPPVDRTFVLAEYKAGRLDVLVNVNVLTEGFDDPPTSACILARGCGSAGVYLQIVGRILRTAPGKADAVLVDLRGVTHDPDIGRPDIDRHYSLDGKGIRSTETDTLRFCQICGNAMDLTAPKCLACGWELDAEQASPTVANVMMKKLARDFLVSDDGDKRAARLGKWLREAKAKGHKPGAALYKFRACYGAMPSPALISRAWKETA